MARRFCASRVMATIPRNSAARWEKHCCAKEETRFSKKFTDAASPCRNNRDGWRNSCGMDGAYLLFALPNKLHDRCVFTDTQQVPQGRQRLAQGVSPGLAMRTGRVPLGATLL